MTDDERDEDEGGICPTCNGSGESRTATWCWACRGTGERT
jgi:DnaJ-class molecular chaperone